MKITIEAEYKDQKKTLSPVLMLDTLKSQLEADLKKLYTLVDSLEANAWICNRESKQYLKIKELSEKYALTKGNSIRPLPSPVLKRFKSKLVDDQRLLLSFDTDVDKWSEKQRGLVYELIDRYAEDYHYNKIRAKHELKFYYGKWVDMEDLKTNQPQWTGNFYQLYEEPLYFKSFTAYGKKELAKFTDQVLQCCLELGIDCDDIVETLRRHENVKL